MQEQQGRETWSSKLARIVNSAMCFSLAYILFTYLFWLVMGLSGKVFGFDSFVYYYQVKFILLTHLWTKLKVSVVYSSGPFFVLLLGLFCLYLYDVLKKINTVFNLFLVWCFVVGTSMFGTQGIIASLGIDNYHSPFYQNFAAVFAWWRMPAWVVYLLTVPFTIIFIYFSVNYVRPFLRFAYSYSKVNKQSRRKKFYVETVILPFLLGCIITTIATFPMNMFVHAMYLMMMALGLLIAWGVLHYIEIMRDDVLKYTALQTPNVVLLFFLVVAFIYIFIAGKGVYLSIG